MTKLHKLKVHPSFYFFAAVIIALGYIKQLLLVLIATTVHEMCHVAAAKLFGYETSGITITPIGETAVIEHFNSIPAVKKYIIVLAGPLSNIIPAVLLYLFGFKGFFTQINFVIGAFNLLPIFPLDGGKVLHTFLGNKIGIIKSGRIMCTVTKIGIALLCVLGFAQTVLHPFNISLIAISAFLIAIYKKEKEETLYCYYKCMLNKYKRLHSGIITKEIAVSSGADIKRIHERFTWDYYHIILVVEDGKIVKRLTETEVFNNKTI